MKCILAMKPKNSAEIFSLFFAITAMKRVFSLHLPLRGPSEAVKIQGRWTRFPTSPEKKYF